MSINRLVPLASIVWSAAFLIAVPHAAQQQPPRPGAAPAPVNPHAESLFTPSENCIACHNVLVTPSGEDVSIGATWRSTMMANSGRDPYWQAAVRRETIDHPTQTDAIQTECAACHMPMLQKVS